MQTNKTKDNTSNNLKVITTPISFDDYKPTFYSEM